MSIDTLSLQLIELYDKISSWEHSVIRDTELTPAQMHTIEVLGHHPDLRMKELAERLGVTTGTLTVAVDKLEQKDLVSRVPHEHDRRSWRVMLTPKGAEMFDRHHRFHVEFTREIFQEFQPEELNTLSRLLSRVLVNM